MAEKKKTDKKEKPIVKKVISPKANVGTVPKKLAEEKYPAYKIAENLHISEFSFYIIKQETGITDNSFLTISEFQKIYDEISR